PGLWSVQGLLLIGTSRILEISLSFGAQTLQAAPEVAIVLALVSDGFFGWTVAGMAVLFVAFPDRRPTGRFERLLIPSVLALAIVNMVATWLAPSDPLGMYSLPGVANPYAAGEVWSVVLDVALPAALILTFLAGAHLVVRWRRSTGTVRLQYRWMGLTVPVLLATFVLGVTASTVQNAFLSGVSSFLFELDFALFAVAVAGAVTRDRLFEIDRILKRTWTYLIVLAGLGLVFVLLAVWVPQAILGAEAPPWLVAASTLIVFMAFGPVRVRVQRWLDRRFFRSGYVADAEVERLGTAISNETSPEVIAAAWAAAVGTSLSPEAVDVWTAVPRRVAGTIPTWKGA
ncbi:MAG: hypothetical protein AB1Z55_08530, partial [Acidimicrobiia bacterium]